MEKIKGYVAFEELKKGLSCLENPQDKFIVLAIYNGISGKQMADLLNLKVEDVDFKNHDIKIKNKYIKMDELFEEITSRAIKQTTMYSELSTGHGVEEIELNMESPYVIKVRPRAMNLWGLEPMKYSGFRVRFATIVSKMGLEISATELETSGVLNRLLKKNRPLTVLDIEYELRKNNENYSSYRLYSKLREINGGN